MKEVAFWLLCFMEGWHGETPLRIHSRNVGDDGAPDWHPDFARWIEREEWEGGKKMRRRQSDQRIKTTRAFRRLRTKAPREFDVVYSIVVHRSTMQELATAMTARAIRLGKPERYTPGGILVLTVSGVDKMIGWWSADSDLGLPR